MATLIRSLTSCLGRNPYATVDQDYYCDKRDDGERSFAKVEAWKEKYPVTEDLQAFFSDHTKFCKNAIADLLRLPLTSGTIPIIGKHLKALARQSSPVRRHLLDELNRKEGDFSNEQDRAELVLPLIGICYDPMTGRAYPEVVIPQP